MQDMHIYEVLNRTKHSTVYKGRQKKSIHYYGVKSVEKGQRPFVLQEVKVLRAVKHPNILKFFNWYETTNHLWLILEYCVGGDLLTLLRQDNKLPEPSIHDIGRDLVSALQALHAKGVVHCDLKPSNVLLDENGRVKLGGFGLAQRLGEIQKIFAMTTPPPKRGTPCYMAPELFQDRACHSFASDFWAFGCILYECAVGHPPFVSNSFATLVDSILYDGVDMPADFSEAFRDLVGRCLEKNPAKRLSWEEVAAHPFWKSELNAQGMPEQAAFDDFARRCGYVRVQDTNGGTGNGVGVGAGGAALAPSGRTLGGADGKRGASKPRGNGHNGGIDVVRLSRIANRNMQQQDGADYGASTSGDIKLEDADTELDFSEEISCAPVSVSAAKVSAADHGASDYGSLSEHSSDTKVSLTDDERGDGSEGSRSMEMRVETDTSVLHTNAAGGGGADSRKLAIDREISSSSLPSTRPNTGDPHMHGGNTTADGVGGDAEGGARPLSAKDVSVIDLAFHPSDLVVKPIVGNRRIEKQHDVSWDISMLPFEALSLQEMLGLDQDTLESFLSQIYKSIVASPSVSEKLNVLLYFEGLCKSSGSANILINSSLMHMFVTRLRASKVASLQTQFAGIIGTLVRHATFIGEDVPKTGIIDSLTDALRDKHEAVRRKSMSALGELLFYIVTQEQEEGLSHANGSPWYIPNGTNTTICRLLRNMEDPITQHYAVKTLENIFSVGGEWALRIGSYETALTLVHICSTARSESLKVTAASALARLFRCNMANAQTMTDKIGVRAIIGFLGETNAKVQHAFATIFIIAMENASNKTRNALGDESALVATFAHLLDHGSPVLRGKALICILQLSKFQIHWFVKACNLKLISTVERLQKTREEYVYHCVNLLHSTMPLLMGLLQDDITTGVDKLCARKMSGHGQRSYHNSSMAKLSQSVNSACSVLLGVLTSPLFHTSCVNTRLVPNMASWMQRLSKGTSGTLFELQSTLFNILEAISQRGDILLERMDDVMHTLVPVLMQSMTESPSGDIRFLSAKAMCDMVLFYLSEMYVEMSEEGSPSHSHSQYQSQGEREREGEREMFFRDRIEAVLLPHVPSLLKDEEPIPLYALKMLIAVLDFYPELTEPVAALGLATEFFQFLSLDHPNNNVHNLRLCRAMVAAESVDTELVLALGAVERAGTVLCYACENMVEAFIEPSLELCAAIIARITHSADHKGLRDMRDACVGVLRKLGSHGDVGVADMARQCAQALDSWASSEAVRPLVTN